MKFQSLGLYPDNRFVRLYIHLGKGVLAVWMRFKRLASPAHET